MSRTEGSGWGGGPLLYQICPCCGKKKAYYHYNTWGGSDFKCTWCKEWFDSKDLIRLKYASQVKKTNNLKPCVETKIEDEDLIK